jgi:hypothetical protein
METLLLLLWRHITTYIDREEGVTLSVPTSFSQSTRGSVTYDQSAFRAEVTRQLQPALQHLTSLPLVRDRFFFFTFDVPWADTFV